MKVFVSIVLFILCSHIFCEAQLGKNLSLSMGIAYRQYPLSKQDIIRNNVYGFAYSPMWNTGAACIDIGDSLKVGSKKISITLANYFRYTPWLGKGRNDGTLAKGFIHDHLINLFYPFKIKNSKIDYFLGFGLGVMNFGTSFTYSYYTGSYDSSGNPIKANKKTNFKYLSSNIVLGVKKKRLSLSLVSHLSKRDDFFDKNFSFWGEGKLTYSFKLLK